ncbi:hypothetical protein ACLMAL_07740, partial [Nocardia sp. CWNU-33]|uniref:hypothetical protein n=1 Tax=Nocardia sp. CWNU-33 TaxID=3392117 RepID=UPI00398F0F5E
MDAGAYGLHHTTLTRVEHTFSDGVTRAYAGVSPTRVQRVRSRRAMTGLSVAAWTADHHLPTVVTA